MLISRRQTLALIGGGSILAATAGAGTFLATRTPLKALAPWKSAGIYKEPRKRALSFAILAPNPHNRQPWIVDLSSENQITIYRDKKRDLPHTDPHSRQLTIGLGCFLELLRMAAAEDGYNVDLDLFPEGEDGPVAIANFEPGGKPDNLFAHVLNRRSTKEPFETRSVPDNLASSLEEFANIYRDDLTVTALKKLTWDAWMLEAMTPETNRESVELMRLGKAEINQNPDGIDLGGGFLEVLIGFGLLSRKQQLDTNSFSFGQGVEIYNTMLNATPAYVTITSKGNSRLDQIEAGRRWIRLNLATTGMGLALHPVSQALQEYPEMQMHYNKAHELLAPAGHTVQMLGRLGYGPIMPPSPRWPVESKIRNAT
ncbi:MAG: twin-arginine translocation pathway signal protein [Cohaesibacteraceae bacterium]|nr:twin-arginine translocation pathway signal protein [Cohaesibacteraceae bacterium]MBL4876281.1 twin-arginine translocation pathway signal protein [Cohaesibacteraceae bacterium]